MPILLLSLLLSLPAASSETDSLRLTPHPDPQRWEQLLDQLATIDEAEAASWQDAYDDLAELAEHPIDLNTATREQLEQLLFLTDLQIEELSEYIYRYAPLRSLGELAMIESLDPLRRQLLQCFVTLADAPQKSFPTYKDIMKYGRHELIGAMNLPLYDRRGDRNGYMGYKYKHWLRYTFSYSQYVKAGLVGSQDAGEPFFGQHNPWGYDYYSFYVQLRRLGPIKNIVAGRYRLKFGLGLVLNNDFGFGKQGAMSQMGSATNAIRAHSSRSEYNYMQGLAATVTLLPGLDASAFVSYRDIDGTPSSDSTAITAIVKSGYHRTRTEMAHKHNTSQTVFGGNMHYFCNGFHIGLTALHTTLDKLILPNESQLYRRYYAKGSTFWNASIDYGYLSRRLSIQGETATGNSHAVATLHTISFMPTNSLTLQAVQRFYSYKYYALFGQSFSDGGRIQNESGLYVGATWQPSRRLSVMAYADYCRFAWPRYGCSRASHSFDAMLSASLQMGSSALTLRYRMRMRQQDATDKLSLVAKNEHRGRLAFSFQGSRWNGTTQIDAALCHTEGRSLGYMASQNLGYVHGKWRIYANFGYFNTDDFSSRLYTYERGLMYAFSFPVCYGEGIRYALNARVDLSPSLMLMAKVGTTNYFDRNSISTSYQMIAHSSKTDIELQARIRLSGKK